MEFLVVVMIEVYFLNLFILICIYALTAVSFNFSFGYTGLLNLAHMSLFGLGAYIAAMLSLLGAPFFASFILGGIIPMFFAFLLSFTNKKLRGDYFALATFAFAILLYGIFLNLVDVTGGPNGLRNIPKPFISGFDFNNIFNFATFAFACTFAGIFFIYRITKSPFGNVCIATRDNVNLAESLGKNTFKVMMTVLMISAFFAGIAGSLYTFYISFVDPSILDVLELIPILSIVIIGGLASIKGTIIGTFIVLIIPEILRFFDVSSSILGPLRLLLYSTILLFVIYYKPRGLYGRITI